MYLRASLGIWRKYWLQILLSFVLHFLPLLSLAVNSLLCPSSIKASKYRTIKRVWICVGAALPTSSNNIMFTKRLNWKWEYLMDVQRGQSQSCAFSFFIALPQNILIKTEFSTFQSSSSLWRDYSVSSNLENGRGHVKAPFPQPLRILWARI